MKQKQTLKNLFRIILMLFFVLLPSYSSASTLIETHTTQGDWEGGTLSDLDTTTSPGDIKLSSGLTAWLDDGEIINDELNSQLDPQIVSDGSGGAIIVWQDQRNDDGDIYAQRVDASGNIQWNEGGVIISNAADTQRYPQIISDGSGGALIVWGDSPVCIQKIDSSGNVQWDPNGVIIDDGSFLSSPHLTSDGSGGAIVTWYDEGIYAQKINSSGVAQWLVGGELIGGGFFPRIISDSFGGAIISWWSGSGIYAQKINSSGDVQWTVNGEVITSTTITQYYPAIISDGSNGAIISWRDERDDEGDVYIQKINSSGDVQWTANGVMINNEAGEQGYPKLISDGSGGAIILFSNGGGGSVQKINSSGEVQWTAGGISINNYECTGMISDGSNGAIIVCDNGEDVDGNIYAQKINSSGASQWTSEETIVSNADNRQTSSRIVSDGSDGAIIAWTDSRNDDGDIYAQKIGDGYGNYTSPGIYTSSVIDATTSSDWDILETDETIPANTSISYETRTSEGDAATNLSLTSTASASSEYNPGILLSADNAIDGIDWEDGVTFSAWANDPATDPIGGGETAYLELDYGAPTTIGRVNIDFISSAGNDYYATDFQIQTCQICDGSDWTDQETVVGNTDMSVEYTFSPAITTERIRIFITGANLAGLVGISELETYAGSWSAWQALVGDVIQSANGRYLQYRATLATTDTSTTPTLSEARIYVSSAAPPAGTDSDSDGIDDDDDNCPVDYNPDQHDADDDDKGDVCDGSPSGDDDDDQGEDETVSPITIIYAPPSEELPPYTPPYIAPTTEPYSTVAPEAPITTTPPTIEPSIFTTAIKNIIEFIKAIKDSISKAINAVGKQIYPAHPTVAAMNTMAAALPFIPVAFSLGSLANIPIWTKELFLRILGALGLKRRKKEKWGTIFNVSNGQPISFARVELIDTKTNKAKESKLTDKNGAYFFLAEPGTYTLKITKSGYQSANITDRSDFYYTNTYNEKDTITVKQTSIINQNIPLIQYQANKWEFLTKGTFLTIITIVFWLGFAINLYFIIMYPTILNSIIFFLYFFRKKTKTIIFFIINKINIRRRINQEFDIKISWRFAKLHQQRIFNAQCYIFCSFLRGKLGNFRIFHGAKLNLFLIG